MVHFCASSISEGKFLSAVKSNFKYHFLFPLKRKNYEALTLAELFKVFDQLELCIIAKNWNKINSEFKDIVKNAGKEALDPNCKLISVLSKFVTTYEGKFIFKCTYVTWVSLYT